MSEQGDKDMDIYDTFMGIITYQAQTHPIKEVEWC